MHAYFINLALIVLYPLVFKLIGRRKNHAIMCITFIQMLLFAALRDPSVGTDAQGYINLFQRTRLFPFMDFSYSRHEGGYLLLNKVLQFTTNGQVFIAILAAISLFLFFKFISKESRIPWLSAYLFITLGFYTNTFNLFRQIIAMGIILHSYSYLKENNFVKFFLTVLVAASFHITALSFMIVYFVRNWKVTAIRFTLYLCAGIFLAVFSNRLLAYLIRMFSTIHYEVKSGGGYTLLAVFVLIMTVAILFKKNIINNDSKNVILFNIIFLAIEFQVLALEFALFTRVTSYFSMFLIVFIPEILMGIRENHIRLLGIILIVFLTGIQYYIALRADLSGIVPYHFFFAN